MGLKCKWMNSVRSVNVSFPMDQLWTRVFRFVFIEGGVFVGVVVENLFEIFSYESKEIRRKFNKTDFISLVWKGIEENTI